MTDKDFEALLAVSVAELKAKQKYLQDEFRLGTRGIALINFAEQSVEFSDETGPFVTFRITFVGSHSAGNHSWRWSWANGALPPRVVTRSAQLQQLYHVIGFDVFRQEVVEADEALVGQFVALSCRLLGSLGAYAVPESNRCTYVLLDAVIPTELNRALPR